MVYKLVVHNLKKYKKANLLCQELKPLITILTKAEKFFQKEHRSKYRPIQELLAQIKESNRILKTQYTIQKKILDNKAGETSE